MFKYFTILLLLSAWMITSCEKSSVFTIKGEIKGLKDSEFYLIRQEGEQLEFDTIKVDNGKFSFEGDAKNPDIYMLSFPSVERPIPVFIEPGTFTVSGDIKSPYQLSIKGGEMQEQFDGFNKLAEPMSNLYYALNSEYNVAAHTNDTTEMNHVQYRIDTLTKQFISRTDQYITSLSPGICKAYLISANMLVNPDVKKLEEITKDFSDELKLNKYSVKIFETLENARKTGVGAVAPLFVLKDIAERDISLESYKGKFVLVDFWASWCAPCRKENPELVKIYQEFHGANFDMLGVSIDNNAAAWKQAVLDDRLSWPQVIDNKEVCNKQYGFMSIPSNVLVGPDGKIVAKNIFGKELRQKLSEVLK